MKIILGSLWLLAPINWSVSLTVGCGTFSWFRLSSSFLSQKVPSKSTTLASIWLNQSNGFLWPTKSSVSNQESWSGRNKTLFLPLKRKACVSKSLDLCGTLIGITEFVTYSENIRFSLSNNFFQIGCFKIYFFTDCEHLSLIFLEFITINLLY